MPRPPYATWSVLPARATAAVLIAAALIAAPLTQAAPAAESDVPRATMPLLKQAPTIDGRIGEAEWCGAVRNVGLVSHTTGAVTSRRGVFWVGCDGHDLFVAMKTEAPPDGRILTRAVPDTSRDVRAVFQDDCLELVLDPGRSRPPGKRTYYHVIANARGGLFDWAVDPDNRQNPMNLGWRLPKWRMAQQVVDGWWHVEMAVPLESLGAAAGDPAAPWGLRVARDWKRPFEQSQWSNRPGSYDAQATMPLVVWHSGAPVVRVLSLEDAGKPKIQVAVFNPGDKPLAAQVRLSDAWHRDPPKELSEPLSVGPGQERVLALDARDGGPEGLHQTRIDVTSPDGRTVYYHRAWRWSMHPPKDRWTIGREQRRAVDLQFKYYPYHDKVAFRVGIEALALRDRVRGAEVAVWRADDHGKPAGEPLWHRPIGFQDLVAEEVCEVPRLADGRYVFGVRLAGGEGLPGEPVTQPFVRRVFEWERNRLGIRDEVMPPFTPLEVDGTAVRAVLREHRHGAAGLWDQVTSDGRPLLAAPMRWEVVAAAPDGGGPKLLPVEGRGWKATGQKPAAVRTGQEKTAGLRARGSGVFFGQTAYSLESPLPEKDSRPLPAPQGHGPAAIPSTAVSGAADWSAGPLRAHVTTEYDYDGMMLVRLALAPTGGASVGRLSLVIPLDDARARYMHAVGDGLRSNYAGFTPPGQGRVWDSSKANKLEIVGTFFPYLWVGDGGRGLCWFADTDRDWRLDDKTPTVELVREGKTLNLRVNFITRPGPLQRPREIVFGLQATPTKPMPTGWRRWVASKQVEGGRPVRWMGACYYWGGLSYDVYPYQYRFDYFDKLAEARRSGQPDRQFIDAWMKMVAEKLAPQDTDRYTFFRNHVNAGFHIASTSRWDAGYRLFGYTNPRGVGFHVPEFATFQDEWLRYRWFNRNWGPQGEVGYDVSPSRSFQDYALWYYRKMQTSMDGVYWDNLFLSADFDPVEGRAWTDEQGRVHPTLGLMHMRELVKRTAIMLWHQSRDWPEGRRPPVTLGHTTNALIVPVMSFLNCTMDWEWKYGYEDFQDRFSPDLTVAETIGRQVGAWPTILAGGHPDPKDPRVDFMQRTRLGVALVHEIQVFDYQPKRDADVYAKLFAFGYGLPDCRVFDYWREGHPVRVEGVDARTLAMSRGARAVVVVTDYGAGGTCRVVLDRQKLGLKPDAAAVDLETGAAIDRAAPGVFTFPIKKHDFRILRIQ